MFIKMYSDWSCLWNPGPGGYASILMYNDNSKTISGSENNTTNNRMELMAVIKWLQAIKKKDIPVKIYVDSNYVCEWVEKYLPKWLENWWKLSNKQDVKNKDLWQELNETIKKFKNLERNWVKGHSNDPLNDLVDKLARKEAIKLQNI